MKTEIDVVNLENLNKAADDAEFLYRDLRDFHDAVRWIKRDGFYRDIVRESLEMVLETLTIINKIKRLRDRVAIDQANNQPKEQTNDFAGGDR